MIANTMRRELARLISRRFQHAPANALKVSSPSNSMCSKVKSNSSSASSSTSDEEQSACDLTPELIHHLERTSLVDFDNKEALERLREAIKFSEQLMEVNTDGVEPLFTVLDNESLYLRDDTAEKCSRQDILSNASVTEEDYFVSPPGNVPLEPSKKNF